MNNSQNNNNSPLKNVNVLSLLSKKITIIFAQI